MCTETLTDPFCDYVHDVPVVMYYMWQSRVESNIIVLCNLTMLSHSKHCSANLPLRVRLIHKVKMHEYLISLFTAYELCP